MLDQVVESHFGLVPTMGEKRPRDELPAGKDEVSFTPFYVCIPSRCRCSPLGQRDPPKSWEEVVLVHPCIRRLT